MGFQAPLEQPSKAAANLVVLALAVLKTRLAAALVWIFNTLGTADLLNAFYQGSRLSLVNTPELLGALFHSDPWSSFPSRHASSRLPALRLAALNSH
jgi:hypothetical protein